MLLKRLHLLSFLLPPQLPPPAISEEKKASKAQAIVSELNRRMNITEQIEVTRKKQIEKERQERLEQERLRREQFEKKRQERLEQARLKREQLEKERQGRLEQARLKQLEKERKKRELEIDAEIHKDKDHFVYPSYNIIPGIPD